MGHKFVQYEVDGEEKWAIWSTVVDDFILYDASAEGVVTYEAQQAYERKKQKCEGYIEEIQNGEDPYHGGDLMTEEDIQELKEKDHD